MSIIITKIDDEYWLCSVSHTPVNLQPYTNPNGWKDFMVSHKWGRMKSLCGFELEKEYNLDIHKDFIISERISQVQHEWGISDDLYYSTELQMRKEKILKIKKNEITRQNSK